MTEMQQAHHAHIQELAHVLKKHGENAPTSADNTKQWMTKGKLVLADLIGDNAILSAMQTNENDAKTAYSRLLERNDVWEDAKSVLKKGFEDETKYKQWFDKTVH
ncbi:hypothetical protein [Rickettsiales endosymbiont of Stachyamoeba lipophora]|uniref:hypothetical protein n=1 Tax=Rickettsiales endosymbiont of Stachyamoeba lipophora TaxID=2486578 RepID=UPI000F645169|nr:hypothetical protein [Rickettsiales endosymbiont of Stachyamoeba lipophora]AZL16410.1 hypothetical protein EF513_07735 [Rickettsiales endosymbiont of Stachyamoeba lipophora]